MTEANCETSEATSNSSVGIVLVLLACCCYAVGNCLQRYSLLRKPDEKVLYCLNRHAGWLLGAVIYFSANGIYAVALSFAPVSVLAAVFSLTIVANAVCARWFLGDKVSPWAYPGYAAVLAGSIVFSATVQAEVCHFDGHQLKEVLTSASAIVYWVILGAIIAGGLVYAFRFEKKYPLNTNDTAVEKDDEEEDDVVKTEEPESTEDIKLKTMEREETRETEDFEEASSYVLSEDAATPSSLSLLLAGFIYPASLGATEAVGALILKAVNSLATTMATDEDEQDEDAHLDLWIGLLVVGIFLFAGIVFWLRLVYARFEITAAFPVEFGMLTFASVVGGFAVFEDHQYVTTASAWAGVVCASLLILGGIAIVGIASWKAKVDEVDSNTSNANINDSGSDVASAEL